MKKNRKSSLLIGSVITLLLLLTPYFLYVYKNIDPSIENYNTIFGTIKAGYYGSIKMYVYALVSKFVPLMFLIIWFLTNKHWWVHALIIPISVYFFQFYSVINDGQAFMDEVEFIYSLPLTVAVFVVLYFLRSKLSTFIMAVDLKEEMDERMENPKKIG